jgi:hypothetical protein
MIKSIVATLDTNDLIDRMASTSQSSRSYQAYQDTIITGFLDHTISHDHDPKTQKWTMSQAFITYPLRMIHDPKTRTMIIGPLITLYWPEGRAMENDHRSLDHTLLWSRCRSVDNAGVLARHNGQRSPNFAWPTNAVRKSYNTLSLVGGASNRSAEAGQSFFIQRMKEIWGSVSFWSIWSWIVWNEDGHNALMRACQSENLELVKYLFPVITIYALDVYRRNAVILFGWIDQ